MMCQHHRYFQRAAPVSFLGRPNRLCPYDSSSGTPTMLGEVAFDELLDAI